MTQKTAMQQMLDELIANKWEIPLSLIVKCEELIELEKEQIVDAYDAAIYNHLVHEYGNKYYNQTYGGK